MAVEPVRYRFNVEEYYRMAEAGIFGEDDRVELIEGEIVEMTPIGDPHALCVLRLNNVLAQRLQGRALINPQNPLRLDDFSEPQPDIVVVKPRRYDRHPRAEDVLLVIEVSDTSVRYDRQVKGNLYARHGIPEVWQADLPGDRLVVHRDPPPRGYRTVRELGRGERISPALLPEVELVVGEILG